jgi:hypothetical protein
MTNTEQALFIFEIILIQSEETLKIPNTFTFALLGLEIFFMLKNKCHNKINNYRRSNGKKRKINEIHPYPGCINSQFFSPPGANSECS